MPYVYLQDLIQVYFEAYVFGALNFCKLRIIRPKRSTYIATRIRPNECNNLHTLSSEYTFSFVRVHLSINESITALTVTPSSLTAIIALWISWPIIFAKYLSSEVLDLLSASMRLSG